MWIKMRLIKLSTSVEGLKKKPWAKITLYTVCISAPKEVLMWHQSQIILKWQGFIPEQKRVPPSPSGALIVGLISQWGGLCAPNLRCRPLSCISCVAEIFKGWTHSVWFTLFVCSWRFCWTIYLISFCLPVG